MAETASIISPDKKVIVPDNTAGCSLAESITGRDLQEWKRENPGGVVVSYINTTADVKAYTDICCTSANALKVVEYPCREKFSLCLIKISENTSVIKQAGDGDLAWKCCVHQRFNSRMVLELAEKYPKADILIHPESSCSADPEIHRMSRAWFYDIRDDKIIAELRQNNSL